VLRWVTVLGWGNTLAQNQTPRSTSSGHPSVGRRMSTQQKLGSKQAQSHDTLACIRGLAVLVGVWLRTS